MVTSEQGKQLTEIEKLINCQIEPLELDGFTPRPPPNEAVEPAPPPVVSRFERPVFAGQGVPETAKAPPRTLGSKFPSRRRRRL